MGSRKREDLFPSFLLPTLLGRAAEDVGGGRDGGREERTREEIEGRIYELAGVYLRVIVQ